MRFWPWALEAYARPNVATACLDLQDLHGQSVPYLLWAAWAAHSGRDLTPEVLRCAAALAARWDDAASSPLRQARRGLKPSIADLADPAREALRAEVKALELKAEQTLMTALEALTPNVDGPPQPLEDALAAAGAAWRVPPPFEPLRHLAAALG
jgi:uncharacterized protein (TIGR02444 family)